MDIKTLLTKKYADLPVWAWGLVAIAGIGIGYYFYHRSKTSSTSTATTPGPADTSTLTGTSGLGDYQAVGPSAGGANNPGATVINIGTPASNPSNWLTTLNLTGNGPIPIYQDAGTPGSTLLSQQIGTVPSGGTVQATGPEVVGAWAPSQNGSELWYPISYQGLSGFISAYYVANASSGIQNQPVVPPTSGTGATIRAKTTSGPFATYDKSHSGVPFYTTLGGKSSSTVPFGASITVLQTGLNGPATSSTKDTSYTQITYNNTTGYVSSQDIASASSKVAAGA